VVRLVLRYRPGCPHRLVAQARFMAAARETGLPAGTIELERVATQEEAEWLQFVGSPTFLVDDHDLFESPERHYGLTCRTYETPAGFAGSPTKRQLVLAMRRVLNG
jgi:hypothetical protein